jgi:hypothetical protein
MLDVLIVLHDLPFRARCLLLRGRHCCILLFYNTELVIDGLGDFGRGPSLLRGGNAVILGAVMVGPGIIVQFDALPR